MTGQHPEPRVDVAEADLLEQQAAVGAPTADQEPPGLPVPSATDSADVADRLEQLEDVPGEDDEDYPHEV